MALYSPNLRVTGEQITAAKYMADHQVHADSQTPQLTEDYSASVAQMQSATDPGELGTESQATTLAGELERLRFAIGDAKGTTQWYETPSLSLAAVNTTLTGEFELLKWGII